PGLAANRRRGLRTHAAWRRRGTPAGLLRHHHPVAARESVVHPCRRSALHRPQRRLVPRTERAGHGTRSNRGAPGLRAGARADTGKRSVARTRRPRPDQLRPRILLGFGARQLRRPARRLPGFPARKSTRRPAASKTQFILNVETALDNDTAWSFRDSAPAADCSPL